MFTDLKAWHQAALTTRSDERCQKINASFAILYFYHKTAFNGILFAKNRM
jgi:hypothetical protein